MHYVATIVPRLCCLGLRASSVQPLAVRRIGQAVPSIWFFIRLTGRSHDGSPSTPSSRLLHNDHRSIPSTAGPSRQLALNIRARTVNASGRGINGVRCFRTSPVHDVDSSPKFGYLTEQEYQKHPSKFNDLPSYELKTIFGPLITKRTGNNLLMVLQKQRITGTLDQEVDVQGATPQLIAQGLAWLRKNYALDEDAAILKRVQEEDRQMEEDFIKNVEKYKNYVPQQRAAEEGIYGKSRLEELRKRTEAKAEAREKQAKEIRNTHGNTAVVSHAKGRAILTGQNQESSEWVKRYKERAALSKLLEPPEMSLTRRLLPSTIFAAIFLVLCVAFASNYFPPIKEARFFPDTPPAAATVSTLIAMNFIFFMMWKLPFFWRLMNKNFLLIAATPYPLSLLGNIFSHQSFTHLLTNMTFLWIVGTRRKGNPSYKVFADLSQSTIESDGVIFSPFISPVVSLHHGYLWFD